MNRTTIDFGIDLGTTNSSVAVLKGTDTEIVKNNESLEITPSAVALNKEGNLYVGLRAKNRSGADPDNTFFEFKLQMGTDTAYTFKRTGQRVKPEDLSAEVLKSLRADVMQRTGEDMRAAVITVPAAFELPQCDATKRAAELAGIAVSPLLQEPVAAALAYGFQSESDRVFWLAYDLGGGTFDAAVIQVRDGVIQVVNHGGDNHLGGKDIDRAIVEQLLVPALTRERPLADFRRGNPRWKTAFAKLKLAAEEAKVRVSRDEKAEILVENLCQDDDGDSVDFEYDLRRADVERVAEPVILRSINICKRVLAEKRLGVGNVEKVLLVGGPTLMPYLRERLSDEREGLGLPLDYSIDPLTVVARGAAVFGGTQRTDRSASRPVAAGQYAIELEYKPVGDDPEPLVGGKVLPVDGEQFSGFTVEFINNGVHWRSGKIPLAQNGSFVTNLWAEKGRPNIFLIELRDATGTKLDTAPDRLTYTIGLAITDPPLTHDVGVATANNVVELFFEKGTPLPARKRKILRQAYHVRRGRMDESIRIPIVEGESKRADRNQKIGYLEITADKFRRDVPAGSEIEVTIDIDQSRTLLTKAYIPILDEEFEDVVKLGKRVPARDELLRDAGSEKKRLETLRQKLVATEDVDAAKVLDRVDREKLEQDIDGALSTLEADPDAPSRCHKRLLDLKAAIDEAEDALEVPSLIREARQLIGWTEEVVTDFGTPEDERLFAALNRDLEAAMSARSPDPDVLRRKIDELYSLRYKLLSAQPDWWVGYLEFLAGQREKMSDQSQADLLIAQGRRSISNNDLDGLKSACRQLISLLPADEQDVARGFGSTVI